jgi:hypothetical protein
LGSVSASPVMPAEAGIQHGLAEALDSRLRGNDKTVRASILAKYNLMAKPVQINPRKSKENQAKKLGFPWIPLAESGLFNALQRFQIKKFPSVSTRVSGCWSKAFTRVPNFVSRRPNFLDPIELSSL